ncbi:hypothetical protein D6851_02990 [Altericroceibacterium spongiae]|uniref:Uncharacterized protein n=1 Tax=Altericroceibacterium spongiae TaxID=2320269 RepID=A0A420ERU5_9SPHN|nr:hypothetical protein D6851_02990 [Altericroceibacterium spongiae]
MPQICFVDRRPDERGTARILGTNLVFENNNVRLPDARTDARDGEILILDTDMHHGNGEAFW